MSVVDEKQGQPMRVLVCFVQSVNMINWNSALSYQNVHRTHTVSVSIVYKYV